MQLTLTSAWLLLPIDCYFIFERTNFARKVSTYILKFSRRIFNYFVKIKSSKFCKKDILAVVVILVLDLIKASVYCTPEKRLYEFKKCGRHCIKNCSNLIIIKILTGKLEFLCSIIFMVVAIICCVLKLYWSLRFLHFQTVAQRYSVKSVFLKTSQNSQEDSCVAIPFLIKFIKKETPKKVFSSQFCKIS